MSGVPTDAFRKLLQSRDLSDFIISTNSVEFKVHKAIIAAGSAFFRTACQGGFKEEINGRVDFPADLPDTIARVTTPHDIDLRQYIIEQCVMDYGSVQKDEPLLRIIKKHEFMAWTTAQRSEARLNKLQEEADGV